MTSLDNINGRSIQTLLRGENDLKQSYEIQAKGQQVKLFMQRLVRGWLDMSQSEGLIHWFFQVCWNLFNHGDATTLNSN